jgi:adenylate cyclase, class 1
MLEKTFDDNLLQRDNIADLRKPAYITQLVTVLNAGVDPFSAHTRRGEHLTSNRTDALRYGGRLENLTLSIDQIIVTSWQEVLTCHYHGVEGMFKCLQDFMQWSPPSTGERPPPLNACSHSCYRGNAIAQRIEELFNAIYDCFYHPKLLPNTRYILGIEWDYYVLSLRDDSLHWVKVGNLERMHQYLASPSPVFRRPVFDPSTLNDVITAQLYTYNRPGIVQCFLQISGNRAIAHIIDERGSYFTQETDFYDAHSLINHYQQFFSNVHQRMMFFNSLSTKLSKPPMLEFYFLSKDKQGAWQLIEHRKGTLFKLPGFFTLQVITDYIGTTLSMRIYCNDREFTSLEFGVQLYDQVAHYMLSLRRQQEKYPIYITDIDLSRSLLGENTADVQSLHYLNYKREIEDALYQAISRCT